MVATTTASRPDNDRRINRRNVSQFTAMTTRRKIYSIPFGAVGYLPAPTGHEAPQIFLLPLWGKGNGAVKVDPYKPTDYPPSYSFTPLKPTYWRDWQASGWEDCEVGRATIRATAPNGERYRWELVFGHDGDPRLEMWGATFTDDPALETAEF